MVVFGEDSTPAVQLIVAMICGMAIGLNRDLHGKPTGVRTLGLVGLGSALVTVATIHYAGQVLGTDHPDAASRVLQGVIQGILAGIGFVGAGVILHDTSTNKVHGLTTAATVWVTAALGIGCGLAQWSIVLPAMILVLVLLIFGGPFEQRVHKWLKRVDGTDPGGPV